MGRDWKTVSGHFNGADGLLYENWVKSAPDGSTFVELGVLNGRSSACLLSNLLKFGKLNCTVFCIDLWPHPENIIKTIQNLHPWINDMKKANPNKDYLPVRFISMDSLQAHKLFSIESIWGVFLDTDHTGTSIVDNVKMWWKKIAVGGRMGFHDYQDGWPEVVISVDKIFSNVIPRQRTGSTIDFEKQHSWGGKFPIT